TFFSILVYLFSTLFLLTFTCILLDQQAEFGNLSDTEQRESFKQDWRAYRGPPRYSDPPGVEEPANMDITMPFITVVSSSGKRRDRLSRAPSREARLRKSRYPDSVHELPMVAPEEEDEHSVHSMARSGDTRSYEEPHYDYSPLFDDMSIHGSDEAKSGSSSSSKRSDGKYECFIALCFCNIIIIIV
ncbi:hypothetical protein EGW08_022802, partial [Elysia chlorotica]